MRQSIVNEDTPCLSVRYQVAQKFHAVTAPPLAGDRLNLRFRDVADLVLLIPLLDDRAAVRRACVEVFTARGQHAWPPMLHVHNEWISPYAALAASLGVQADLTTAVDIINAFIRHPDTAVATPAVAGQP